MGYMAPTEGHFKGYPTITIFTGRKINGEDEYVSLGVVKAAAICEHIDHIRKFVHDHEGK